MPPSTGIYGPLLLEEPLVRTPYELLRRSHRSAQRQVEKEFTVVQTQLANLLRNLTGTDADKETTLARLDTCSERVRGLKRKLDDLQPAPGAPGAAVLRERLSHIDGALLAPAHAREAEKEAERARDLALLSGKKEESELEAKDGEDGSEDDAMEVDGADEKEQEIAKLKAKARAKAKAEITEHFEKKSTSSASAALNNRAPGDRTVDRYIVDHLLRTGRMKTAKTLAASQGIESLVDIKLFAELVRIETALLEKHSVTEALAWCGENRGTLKKQESDLEFTLRTQEFIELCRRRDTAGAIAYARKNLAPWAATHMPQLQSSMTLLAFGETTGVQAYRKLYDASRWNKVREEFRETFLGIYGLPSQSLLALSLSAGLSSLRLPACAPSSPLMPAKEEHQPAHTQPLLPIPPAAELTGAPVSSIGTLLEESRSRATPHAVVPEVDEDEPAVPQHIAVVDCPTCAEDMRVLAKEVPMAHHVNSTLVCAISGDVMDSNNEPMAFPNGSVYSSRALTEMAKNNFDVVTCPRTGETCAFSRLRKVYIS
ncbi:hypothetical protein CC85DRAFT_283788 [Cutaneotrichosporon oleaginosum]|uniref:Macrophage erythroblast attacher n=1 Tax=Cutaneotrichosporon oleaginosum TaxID=879819 RepID=A0A0J0XT63_9TREE|nr:uncharacterized protein CC85DRAFT_283788 [Cutaneotrichosporon oleaginosum]KLT44273.1 hypothetical protein CC85DRAFT_283788 [Cutaneotrichosporon oleaginosum]TXT11559.1 hypothetical protein COLE_01969 [Cutaneotrichosporon oleaginosum]